MSFEEIFFFARAQNLHQANTEINFSIKGEIQRVVVKKIMIYNYIKHNKAIKTRKASVA